MTTDLDKDTIREHYRRIAPVMDELAKTGENETIGLNDYSGWYVKRDHDDFDAIEAGYDREGRCATLATDYEKIVGRIDRALYALTSYKDPDALRDWEPCTISDGETDWQGSAPTPGYGDLRGMMAWGDIDLRDELKPQRSDLDADTRHTIERTLSAYMDEFATLYGNRDAVFALDSVGGAYIMGAPAASLPIAELFDDDADARTRVMEAFKDRSNDWLQEAQGRIEDRIDGASDVIDPDWVNNCNRQYKAPLSLHTDHDAVVVPLSTDEPMYELVPFDEVDPDLVGAARSWAADLTAVEGYSGCVDTLVKRLWPDEYADADDWQHALESWVTAERERERREEEAKQRARERRRERQEQMAGGIKDQKITPHIQDVYDALDDVPTADVVKNHACHEWDTGRNTSDKTEFDPSWRTSNSGNSCYVDTSENTFGDPGMGGGGYAPKAMALGSASIAYRDPSNPLDGEQWRDAVDELRRAGYDIPVWTPDAKSQDADGEEYEQMPYWSVRTAAVALGVLPEDAFIPAQNERGGYEKFPGRETYNHALAAIEDAGLEHGREYMTATGERPDSASSAQNNAKQTPDSTPESEAPAESETTATQEQTQQSTPAVKDDVDDFESFSALDRNDGGYGYWKSDESTGKTWYEPVTNFTIDVDSFLFKDDERLIHLTVVPGSGEAEYDLTVPSKVFNDARTFRDNIVTGLTTTFEGGPADLNELRKLVGGQEAPVRTGTHHMGLHPDTGEFVTPNGVLTRDGWCDDPEKAYMEREIAAERAFGLNADDHTDYNPKEITEILERLPRSRFSQRFLPALGWLYSAPLRPHIQEWEGQFNTLHVTGETGAGKSSTLSVLWQLLGMNGESMSCDDTKFALTTAMASTNSIPMWFDEYKPGDMKDWEVDRFQNLMRSTTRGGIATRGNADKSTEEYKLRAPLMISGEQSIQGPAEQRRTVQTRFKDGVKEPGSPTKRAFAELTGMAYERDGETIEPDGYDLEQHALAYYRFILRQPAEKLKELWADSRSYIRDLFEANGITGVDDLPRQGVQTVYFGMTLYRVFADEMADEAGVATDSLDLPSRAELDEALLYIARQYGDGGSRKSHLDRFVELSSRAATEDYLEEGKHFKFVNEGQDNEQLALKLSSTHDRVSKYVRDHGLDSEDLLNNASDYRDRMAEEADETGSYTVTHSQKTPPLARCARIDTGAAGEQLEFSRLSFGADPNTDEGEEAEGGDNDGDDDPPFNASPIADAARSPTGYQTVTAKVASVEALGEGENTTTKAVLVDETDAIDLVTWDDTFAATLSKFEGETVAIRNAETGHHDGTVQLQAVSGVTDLIEIQAGVGYTEGVTTADDQYQLDDADNDDAGETDADDLPPGQPVKKHLRTECTANDEITTVAIAGAVGIDADEARRRLERRAQRDGMVERLGDDEWRVLR